MDLSNDRQARSPEKVLTAVSLLVELRQRGLSLKSSMNAEVRVFLNEYLVILFRVWVYSALSLEGP